MDCLKTFYHRNCKPTWTCLTSGIGIGLLLLLAELSSGQSPEVTWNNKQLSIKVANETLKKLSAGRESAPIEACLNVRLLDAPDVEILGTKKFDRKESRFVFEPRFPLDGGTKLQVDLGSAGDNLVRIKFKIPEPGDSTRPELVKIYPSSNELPCNVLKFYLHFSVPMKKGNVYQHFSIVDVESGKKVDLPFLELEQELWSRDGKRLTLFFDPGRIKRGLKPREDLGPIFMPGKKYHFRVSGKWKNESGIALGKDIVKTFRSMAEDHRTPNLKNWKLTQPSTKSRDPLTIEFGESLDSALITRVLQIRAGKKNVEIHKIELQENDQKAVLIPKQPWSPGDYVLVVGSELEDLCGNRIGKPFDVDLSSSDPGQQVNRSNTSRNPADYRIKFQIR